MPASTGKRKQAPASTDTTTTSTSTSTQHNNNHSSSNNEYNNVQPDSNDHNTNDHLSTIDKHQHYIQQQTDRANTLSQVNTITSNIAVQAKTNIYHELPVQLIELDKLYNKYKPIEFVQADIYSVGAPIHQSINQYIIELKYSIQSIVSLLYTVKLWLQLSLPKLTDQKNLSVITREELIDMLNNIKNNSINIIDSLSKYYAQRGKLVTKSMKYVNDMNYKYSVYILDEKQWYNCRTINLDLRNNVAIIYDMLSKNWDNITVQTNQNYTEMF